MTKLQKSFLAFAILISFIFIFPPPLRAQTNYKPWFVNYNTNNSTLENIVDGLINLLDLISEYPPITIPPTPTPHPVQGLWTSPQELADKPMSGTAWNEVLADANQDFSNPSAADQDSPTNLYCLAAAIVYARTGNSTYRDRVVEALDKLVIQKKPTDGDGRTLGVARQVGAYALAADLVGYRTADFEEWLRNMAENYVFDGMTLLQMFKKRPNNWGAMAFGSLTSIYGYLDDQSRLSEVRTYFINGIQGPDPGYTWGSDSWHCNTNDKRLINPPCTKQGVDLGGLIPDDQRRAGDFNGTESSINNDSHISGWIDGAIHGARVLDRLGMPIWDVDDQAFKRMAVAHEVTHTQLRIPSGKDWVLPIIDEAYGTHFTTAGRGTTSTGSSKNAGYGLYIVNY